MSADRPLRLYPLSYLADGDEVVVGRSDVNSYAVFPPDGAALVQRLAEGATASEAACWYEQTYGESLDVSDFLTTLYELDFVDDRAGIEAPVAAHDGTLSRTVPAPADGAGQTPRLHWQRLGCAMFSPFAWAGYAAVIIIATVLCLLEPNLVPHRDNAFFTQYLLVIEITVALGQIPLILIHECFHVLAARRLGIAAHIRVSHRLYFVVFETAMDGLVLIPRRRRYLPMLAGILADLVIAALLTIVAWAVQHMRGPEVVSGICLALAFVTLVRVALEFMLFLRTDIYYLASTLGGCVDLHTTCREMIRNQLNRLRRREDRMVDPQRWHPNDIRQARWYLPLYLLGYAFAAALFVMVLLPITWRFLHTALVATWHHDFTSVTFWDAAGLLALNGAQPAFAGVVALRERAQRRRAARIRDKRMAAASAPVTRDHTLNSTVETI